MMVGPGRVVSAGDTYVVDEQRLAVVAPGGP
jgi:hypothetical protein